MILHHRVYTTVEITHLPDFLNDSLINVKSFRMLLNFFIIITEKEGCLFHTVITE